MCKDCVPYRRKWLYLLLTAPLILMYVGIAVLLWQASVVLVLIYGLFFVVVAIGQAYVCTYLECPYVGKFAPCVGGFCLPSSQIARLFKNAHRTERTYNLAVSIAFTAMMGIILLPVPSLYQRGVALVIAYVGIALGYAGSFLWLICPVCGTRHVCPGGKASTSLREAIRGK